MGDQYDSDFNPPSDYRYGDMYGSDANASSYANGGGTGSGGVTSMAATAAAGMVTGGGSLLWQTGIQVIGSLLGAFSYKAPSREVSAQEKWFGNMVDNYTKIREQRTAAISIASSISGLPEETFYGLKGNRLMRSNTVKVGQTPESQKEKVAEVHTYENQLDAGQVTPPPTSVRQFEQAPTYADAMKDKQGEIIKTANTSTVTRDNPPNNLGVSPDEFTGNKVMSEVERKRAAIRYQQAVQVEKERKQALTSEDKKVRDMASLQYHQDFQG